MLAIPAMFRTHSKSVFLSTIINNKQQHQQVVMTIIKKFRHHYHLTRNTIHTRKFTVSYTPIVYIYAQTHTKIGRLLKCTIPLIVVNLCHGILDVYSTIGKHIFINDKNTIYELTVIRNFLSQITIDIHNVCVIFTHQ